MTQPTIAAPATAPGNSGIAIIRISGDDSEKIFRQLFHPAGKCEYLTHTLYYGHIVYRGETLDECMAVIMRGPRSYTREDVAEFHLHGGDQTCRRVMNVICSLGAQVAQPGEFTKRAFLNGRVDLSRAEAVMSLISAGSEAASRAAVRQLEGRAGGFIHEIRKALLELLSGIEAAIDFPEEIDEQSTLEETASVSLSLADRLDNACDEKGAKVLESGLDVVICGAPNAGKSSLLNELLESDRAIVTDTPGTTRDIIRESVILDGIRVNLSDTAGIRDSSERIEQEGIRLARKALENADVAVHLIDISRPLSPEDKSVSKIIASVPHITVYSKADLPAVLHPEKDSIRLSVMTGEGIGELKKRILCFAGQRGECELTLMRHIRLAKEAAAALREAAVTAGTMKSVSLCTIDLHRALERLALITGESADEELLDTIFSRFCVGK